MFASYPAEDTTGGPSGTFAIDSVKNFGFSVHFTDQQRHILFANSSYYIEPWLVSWMRNNLYSVSLHQNRQDDEIPIPDSMLNAYTLSFFDSLNGTKPFPLMNKANLYDNTNPGFIIPPTNQDSIKQYLYYHWSADNNANWAFDPDTDLAQVWPLPENLAYTNDTLMKAGINGFPLGDLYHWWPTQYAAWKAQEALEDSLISNDLMTGSLKGIVTAIEQPSPNEVPSKFTLNQNYPNPFNPTTQIEYSVPRTSNVTLKVYNILGEEVATLFSGVRHAGNYSVTFDGSKFASGVYFYSLQAGSVSITKKLLLLK